MEVTLVGLMGNDLTVVNAARVSFSKESEYEFDPHEGVFDLSHKDQKLIKYLADHGHWTPFGHIFASFRIKAPLFVARQLGKHQVGLVWNEVSRRYVDSEPEFYVPDSWRKRADNVKQGSRDETIDQVLGSNGWTKDWPTTDVENCPIERHIRSEHKETCSVEAFYKYSVVTAYHSYLDLIDSGVCPEQARMVLPQSMYTEWIWSGSVAAFARVCNLRLDPHTQKERQDVAKRISTELSNRFPHSWRALCTH